MTLGPLTPSTIARPGNSLFGVPDSTTIASPLVALVAPHGSIAQDQIGAVRFPSPSSGGTPALSRTRHLAACPRVPRSAIVACLQRPQVRSLPAPQRPAAAPVLRWPRAGHSPCTLRLLRNYHSCARDRSLRSLSRRAVTIDAPRSNGYAFGSAALVSAAAFRRLRSRSALSECLPAQCGVSTNLSLQRTTPGRSPGCCR